MKPTNVIIIGGSGNIGSALCETFCSNLHASTYASNPYDGGIKFDIEKDRLDSLCTKTDQVTHGLIVTNWGSIDEIAKKPDRAWETNVVAPIDLAKKMVGYGIKPVIFSTDMVFDGQTGGYDEDATPAPINVYGQHKLALEDGVAKLHGDSLILRLSKVITGQLNHNCIVGSCVQAALDNSPIRCIVDHSFNPIWIGDLCNMVSALVHQNASGIFHLCGNETTTRMDIAQKVLHHLPSRLRNPELFQRAETKDFHFQDQRPQNISMVNEKASSATQVHPQSLDGTIQQIVKSAI